MSKPESNAKQIQISSANKIDVARLLEKYEKNKKELRFRNTFDIDKFYWEMLDDHQNTLETIFTALNVPIPQ